ncbi:MAG: hypothetical protein ACT4PE_09415 [Candidatus Eiseniibacteriota bacterium]
MRIRSFLVLPSAAALLAAAVPVGASQPDSWEGNLFMRDVTDLLAFPHRAIEDKDFALGTHVPSVSPSVSRTFGDEAENSLDVSGLLSFGAGERFSLFFAANDPRGYNPTAGFVVQSVRGPGAALSEGSFALGHQTRGLATSGTPDEKMQLGAAVHVNPQLDAGAFFSMGKYEWKGTITPATGTPTTSGRETGYFNLTGSVGWTPGVPPIDKLEVSFSYAMGEQDEFGVTTLSGSGDNSSYGGAAFLHFSSSLWGWRPIVTVGYAQVTSDFTYYQDPAITTPVPTLDAEETALNVAVGGTRPIGGGGTVAATLGVVRHTDKFESMQVSGFDSIIIDETITVNPSCSFAVDVPIFSKFSLASGVNYQFGAFEGETAETVAGVTDNTTEDDKDLAADWSAGLIWNMNEHVQISATMHDDAWTDNPVRGDSEDEWVGVLRTQFSF